MIIRITFIIFLLSITNCKSQIKSLTITKEKRMEYFDKRTFDEHKVNYEYSFILEDGSVVRQRETPNVDYTEQITNAKSPYTISKVFYYKTGNLRGIGKEFYSFQTGIWKEYDELGRVLKEIDRDKQYKFSIEDLAKKIKEEVGLDIMKKEVFDVRRATDPKPKYEIYYRISESSYDMNVIIVDGITGNIISKTIQKRIK